MLSSHSRDAEKYGIHFDYYLPFLIQQQSKVKTVRNYIIYRHLNIYCFIVQPSYYRATAQREEEASVTDSMAILDQYSSKKTLQQQQSKVKSINRNTTIVATYNNSSSGKKVPSFCKKAATATTNDSSTTARPINNHTNTASMKRYLGSMHVREHDNTVYFNKSYNNGNKTWNVNVDDDADVFIIVPSEQEKVIPKMIVGDKSDFIRFLPKAGISYVDYLHYQDPIELFLTGDQSQQQQHEQNKFLSRWIPVPINNILTVAKYKSRIIANTFYNNQEVIYQVARQKKVQWEDLCNVISEKKVGLLYDAILTYRHGLIQEIFLNNIMSTTSWNDVHNFLEFDLPDFWEQDIKGLWRCARWIINELLEYPTTYD
ncbi:hypothetical protein BDA99DRAFT_541954 [Phascolomyces articulosus]|uniref:Uncharacterized protein n=1 Tax=Phascolomyces articulosus TaxID=60185 RepID=A0AAD5JRK9_9FUNG|nr:hypothetical protein BDA99DRAFT_541954 [Phascolomyces articulosus]